MSGADFDAIMYGVTEEQRQICENAPEIILTGTIGICGWVEKTEKDSTPNVGLVWADDGVGERKAGRKISESFQ